MTYIIEHDLARWADALEGDPDLAAVLRAVAEQHPSVDIGGRWYCEKCRTQVEAQPHGQMFPVYAADLWPCATVRAVLAVVKPILPPDDEHKRVPIAPSVQPPEVAP